MTGGSLSITTALQTWMGEDLSKPQFLNYKCSFNNDLPWGICKCEQDHVCEACFGKLTVTVSDINMTSLMAALSFTIQAHLASHLKSCMAGEPPLSLVEQSCTCSMESSFPREPDLDVTDFPGKAHLLPSLNTKGYGRREHVQRPVLPSPTQP